MHAKLIKRWEAEKQQKDQIALTTVNGNRFSRSTVVGASGRPLLSDEHSIDNIPETKFAPYPFTEAKTASIEPVFYPSIKENKVGYLYYFYLRFLRLLGKTLCQYSFIVVIILKDSISSPKRKVYFWFQSASD